MYIYACVYIYIYIYWLGNPEFLCTGDDICNYYPIMFLVLVL